MTTDEKIRAERAQVIRNEIEEIVSVEGASFLDRSPIIGAVNPIAMPMTITTSTDKWSRQCRWQSHIWVGV